MYCPECATENIHSAKFCRLCGTNLELVSMAIAGNRLPANQEGGQEIQTSATDSQWLQQKAAGMKNVVLGSILLGVSLLIALVAFLVSTPGRGAWFFVWTVFFGWLACWGTISLGGGLSRVIEAKIASRALKPVPNPAGNNSVALPAAANQSGYQSVTEHTTRQLRQESDSK